jgi:DHA2 family multidrug resistance protein
MGFIFIPATMAAYIGVPQEKSNAVAGLINFVRNIGSSVGTSAVTTILARRAQFHQAVLASDTGIASRVFQNSTSSFTGSLHDALGPQARAGAFGHLYGVMLGQASALSYLDTFWVLGVATGIMFLLSFLLRKNHPRRPSPEALAH